MRMRCLLLLLNDLAHVASSPSLLPTPLLRCCPLMNDAPFSRRLLLSIMDFYIDTARSWVPTFTFFLTLGYLCNCSVVSFFSSYFFLLTLLICCRALHIWITRPPTIIATNSLSSYLPYIPLIINIRS